MIELGLIDLIAKKYGKGSRSHTCSKDAPIEFICGTDNFKTLRGGYLSFVKLASDHRDLWIDIPCLMSYGYSPP